MYQKVNEKLESGMTLSWTAGTNETRFGLGCNYKIDDDTSFRVCILIYITYFFFLHLLILRLSTMQIIQLLQVATKMLIKVTIFSIRRLWLQF